MLTTNIITSSVRWIPYSFISGTKSYSPVLHMAARSMGFEMSNRSVSIINCSVDRDNGGYCLRKLKLNFLIKYTIERFMITFQKWASF